MGIFAGAVQHVTLKRKAVERVGRLPAKKDMRPTSFSLLEIVGTGTAGGGRGSQGNTKMGGCHEKLNKVMFILTSCYQLQIWTSIPNGDTGNGGVEGL